MAIWTQVLTWTLLSSLVQGFVVYTCLWLILKLLPGLAAKARYRLSIGAMGIILAGFGGTLWQQSGILRVTGEQHINYSYSLFPSAGLTRVTGQINALQLSTPLQTLCCFLAIAYVAGLAVMLLRLFSGFRQLLALRKKGVEKPAAGLEQLLRTLQHKLQLKQNVRLLITRQAPVPMVIGVLKPVILLPAATVLQLSADQLETVLLHELAHIQRRDFLVNLLQTLAETVLFFNPFVWLCSAIARREREFCCDDLVVAHTLQPASYAAALATLAEQEQLYPSSLALAATGQPYHLLNRLKRILEARPHPVSYSRTAVAALTFTIIAFAVSVASYSFSMVRNNVMESQLSATGRGELDRSNIPEEQELVAQLISDRLIDEAKGFVVEKKDGKLFINYKQVTEGQAAQYLRSVTKKELRIEVFPLQERIRQHPGSSLLQLAAPIQLSSPCVKYSAPQKEGC